MKWSPARLSLRNFNRIGSLLIATLISILISGGGFGQAEAKGRAPKQVSLDEIQLDDAPAKKPDATPVVQNDVIPDPIRLLLAAADMHEKDKDYPAVISTLSPKIDQLPRSGLLQLGRAYAKQKDPMNEIHAIELVTAKNPKDYVALVQLGNAYMEVKRYDDAATVFSSAREVNSKYRPAYDGAWTLLEATDDLAEARTLVQDMIKIFGPDAKTTAALCRMYSGEGFIPEKSEEACRSAIKIDPKNPENYVYLTMSLRDTDQKEMADKVIADAAKRFPASENVQDLAGDMKANDRSYADSYRYYAQAVKVNPKSSKAQLGFAKSAFELQKHTEAIDAFGKACKLDRRTALDFRQAATTLKKNKDQKWIKYQDAIDESCN